MPPLQPGYVLPRSPSHTPELVQQWEKTSYSPSSTLVSVLVAGLCPWLSRLGGREKAPVSPWHFPPEEHLHWGCSLWTDKRYIHEYVNVVNTIYMQWQPLARCVQRTKLNIIYRSVPQPLMVSHDIHPCVATSYWLKQHYWLDQPQLWLPAPLSPHTIPTQWVLKLHLILASSPGPFLRGGGERAWYTPTTHALVYQ